MYILYYFTDFVFNFDTKKYPKTEARAIAIYNGAPSTGICSSGGQIGQGGAGDP